jgi:hypothetical protein
LPSISLPSGALDYLQSAILPFWFIYSHLSFYTLATKTQNRLGLSGGGAKDFILAFKVLEEAGVQIDYIGEPAGLYASGTTPVKLILFFKQLILMSC